MGWFGFLQNAALGPAKKVSSWRNISLSSWKVYPDSTIIQIAELDAEPALACIERWKEWGERQGRPVKVTLTHFAGLVLAKVYERHPDLNVVVRMGRIYPRLSVDICFLISGTHQKENLTVHVVRDTPSKTLAQVAEDLSNQSREVKTGSGDSYRGIKSWIGVLPHFLRVPLIRLADQILNGWNRWTPWLGVPRDPFGSAMLTSVGSLDIELAIPRLFPGSRNALIVSLGAVREKPVVRDGKVVPRKQVKVCFVGDHRVVDGFHAAYLSRAFHELFEHPDWAGPSTQSSV
jgi:pyruvate dehydrogenase E2 component (dihydrolipoamide acetyltransferase)